MTRKSTKRLRVEDDPGAPRRAMRRRLAVAALVIAVAAASRAHADSPSPRPGSECSDFGCEK